MSVLYDNSFFDWVDYTAQRSAHAMLPIFNRMVSVQSVIDVGCGRGTWLSVWSSIGVENIRGLDGDYVDRARLAIPADRFQAADLSRAADVPRVGRFDVAQSLEVAEHLPAASGPAFVGLLCDLSDVVLFSAAQPGQGGEDHINERDPSYWAGLFAEHGYAAFDCVRPRVAAMKSIDPWYRYNSIVFANAAGQQRLSEDALDARVTALCKLDGGGDVSWRLRRAILRPLPVKAVTWLSRRHYSLVCAMRQYGVAAQGQGAQRVGG